MPFKSGIYMASINHTTPSLTPKAAATNHHKYIVNGRYRILQIVGEGSQGKVYKVEDRQENNKMYSYFYSYYLNKLNEIE